MIIHSLFLSRFSYCKVYFMGLSLNMIQKLKLIQNAEASLAFSGILSMPTLRCWLPIKPYRIAYLLCLFIAVKTIWGRKPFPKFPLPPTPTRSKMDGNQGVSLLKCGTLALECLPRKGLPGPKCGCFCKIFENRIVPADFLISFNMFDCDGFKIAVILFLNLVY